MGDRPTGPVSAAAFGAVRSQSSYLGWLESALGRKAPVINLGAEARQAVVGQAVGYDASVIAPFVRSLRAHYDGPTVLIVDDDPEILALLDRFGVSTMLATPTTGWRPHPVVARFADYACLIEGWDTVRHVLLTDTRDVIFQGDPFDPVPDQLEGFEELAPGLSLADHAFNMKHIKAVASEGLAEAFADRPSLCVGTVIGPRAEIARLCRVMLMMLAVPRSSVGGDFGADQAAFNLAIHMGLVDARIRPNYSRVATIGLATACGLTFDGHRVVNADGSISPIVHQYDRHPEIARALHHRWGGALLPPARSTARSLRGRMHQLRRSFMRRTPVLR